MFENFRGTNPKSVLNSLREIIYERLQKLEDVVGSGLSLSSIEFLTITFFENRVTIGSSCKPLPEEIAKLRGAIINVDNSKDDDQQCFKWAVTRAMFPVAGKRDATKLSANLRKQADKLNWNGINFPTTLHEIDIFENLNKISVMVLGWDKEEKLVVYLRKPRTKHAKAVQIFYHENHYNTVKCMLTLTQSNLGKHTYYFCPYCSFKHRKASAVEKHKKDCTMEVLADVRMPRRENLSHSRTGTMCYLSPS